MDEGNHPSRPVRTGVLIADDQGRYVEVDDGASELLGYTPEELLGMAVWDLTLEADALVGYQLWQDFIRIGHQAGTYRLRGKNDKVVWVEYRALANVAPGRHRAQLRETAPGIEPD